MVVTVKKRNEEQHFFDSLLSCCGGSKASVVSPPKLIIAGAPASGKGTQCELIKKTYGVIHLSTGDMLRAAVAAGSDIGKVAKEYMDAGKLVPDEVIIDVVSEKYSLDSKLDHIKTDSQNTKRFFQIGTRPTQSR